MKIVDRIEWRKFTLVGISKKGVTHLGYFPNKWSEEPKWLALAKILNESKAGKQSLAVLQYQLGRR